MPACTAHSHAKIICRWITQSGHVKIIQHSGPNTHNLNSLMIMPFFGGEGGGMTSVQLLDVNNTSQASANNRQQKLMTH